MTELVALHTQVLTEPHLSPYLDMLVRATRAARLNASFPDRRALQATLEAMRPQVHGGLYDHLYVDSRTGLPNLSSVTRIVTDLEVAGDSLSRMTAGHELEARRDEAEVFERLAIKRKYYEHLVKAPIAPVDRFRVQLRRHEPESGSAMFRIDLTKLDATGLYLRVTIELTQISSTWRRRVIDLDEHGESPEASEAFHGTVYRYAAFDAEALFIYMHDIEGVSVDRVQRGVVGPVLYAIPGGGVVARPMEVENPVLRDAWDTWLRGHARLSAPEMLASFQTDVAARDVKEERSNDPLVTLFGERVGEGERSRYEESRRKYPFKVYKDRKFVTTRGTEGLAKAICSAGGTKNLVYKLR